ncbi:MAG: protein kinase [Bryobacteraceae bacterium]
MPNKKAQDDDLVMSLVELALALPPDEREAYLMSACSGDSQLFSQVSSYVDSEERMQRFLLDPLCPRVEPEHPFEPGQLLEGRFQILREVAEGGMGIVYEAVDERLDRRIAIKCAKTGFRKRLPPEVRHASEIGHPNVCKIFEIHTASTGSGEVDFITMEFLDGETLADRLSRGPLPKEEARTIARQLSAGLAEAHRKQVIHGDLKSSNVIVTKTPDGATRAVITDFGLARRPAAPFMTSPSGTLAGTAAYMAPELWKGERASTASDIYAMGVILYELASGHKPPEPPHTESAPAVDLTRKPPPLHSKWDRIIARCLDSDPARRFAADQLAQALAPPVSRRWWWAPAGAAIASCCLIISITMSDFNRGPQVRDAVRVTPESGLSGGARISPDGKWIVYFSDRGTPGNEDIWIQPASGGSARRLTTHPAAEYDPAVSPDGKLVAFRSEREGGGLYLVSSDGSGERLLAAGGQSPAFSPDGQWIAYWQGAKDDAAPSGQLYVISPQGGKPRRIASDFADARYPTWDSSGQFLLFDGCRESTSALSACTDWWVTRGDGSGARNTGALAQLKSQRIELAMTPQKSWRADQVVFSGTRGTYSGLWGLRLSEDRTHPVGPPRTITSGDSGEREPDVAENGSIVFGRITAALHIWSIPLKGGGPSAAPVTDDPAFDGCPSISLDGRWLYFTRKIRGLWQLFVRDLSTGQEAVVYASNVSVFWPVSSADGKRVVFEVRNEADSSIWFAERGQTPRRLCSGCSHPTSWFAGNKGVFYSGAGGKIVLLDVSTGVSRVVLSPDRGSVAGGGDWNARNQYLLFTSGKLGGAKQAFAVRLPAESGAPSGRLIQLTWDVDKVDQPHWSRDGKQFYFVSKRDTSGCVWGGSFSAAKGAAGLFPVMHFHDPRVGPERASTLTRGLAVGDNAIFLSVAEVSDTVWLGRLIESPLASFLHGLSFW